MDNWWDNVNINGYDYPLSHWTTLRWSIKINQLLINYSTWRWSVKITSNNQLLLINKIINKIINYYWLAMSMLSDGHCYFFFSHCREWLDVDRWTASQLQIQLGNYCPKREPLKFTCVVCSVYTYVFIYIYVCNTWL
jgi:hypothetical protein